MKQNFLIFVDYSLLVHFGIFYFLFYGFFLFISIISCNITLFIIHSYKIVHDMYCNRSLNNQMIEPLWPSNLQNFEFNHNRPIKLSYHLSYYPATYKSDEIFTSSTSSSTSFSNGSTFKSKLSPANSYTSINTSTLYLLH